MQGVEEVGGSWNFRLGGKGSEKVPTKGRKGFGVLGGWGAPLSVKLEAPKPKP